MKKALLLLFIFVKFSCFSQVSHLSLIYDFEGKDFDYNIVGIVGANDSLYIVSNTPDFQGRFFCIAADGTGFRLIKLFDKVNWYPLSLIGNDTAIYGTTMASNNGGGALFKYSLKDYTFKFIYDFDYIEAASVRVKYITDSVLWCYSQTSEVDEGSIFSLKENGSELKKVFNETDSLNGENPTDFVFYNDSIYIALYNGGKLFPFGDGTFGYSGCFGRVNIDGSGYQRIVDGGVDKGTQPQSIIIRDNKLFGLFALTGFNPYVGGQFFKCNLDGTSYDSIGALRDRSLTRMLSTDSLIYGISCGQIYGFSPYTNEIRIFENILDNPDFGWDMVAHPVLLNGNVYITAQQGGPNNGGTILKWTNEDPQIINSNLKSDGISKMIALNEIFTDPEGDSLTYVCSFDSNKVDAFIDGKNLIINKQFSEDVWIKITARDGWTGYKTYSLEHHTDISNTKSDSIMVFPNPASNYIRITSDTVEIIEFISIEGVIILSYSNPKNDIDISTLKPGIYFVRVKYNGQTSNSRLFKY